MCVVDVMLIHADNYVVQFLAPMPSAATNKSITTRSPSHLDKQTAPTDASFLYTHTPWDLPTIVFQSVPSSGKNPLDSGVEQIYSLWPETA